MWNCNALEDLSPSHIRAVENAPLDLTSKPGCWLWLGRLDKDGYGPVTQKIDGRSRTTGSHRIAYVLGVGPIPAGLVIDHLCRVRNCINPDHLEPVTARENTRRGFPGRPLKRINACRDGHAWADGDFYVDRQGRKVCRPCVRAWRVTYRAKKRAQASK